VYGAAPFIGAALIIETVPTMESGHAKGAEGHNKPGQQTTPRSLTWGFGVERATKIELAR
jgi:hypothetical protein